MMSALKIDRLKVHIVIAAFLMLLIITSQVMAAQPCAVDPAAGGANILPNVLLIFDNSSSMGQYANIDKNADGSIDYVYHSAKSYSGIFDPTKRYNYNAAGYFEQIDGSNWSGNFLNWVTALRFDVARKVLTGGKITISSGITYITSNSWSYFSPLVNTNDPTQISESIVPRLYNDTNAQTPYNGLGNRYYTNIGGTGSNDWARLNVATTSTHASGTVYNIRIKVATGYTVQGLLDDLVNNIRLGLMYFNTDNEGGKVVIYVNKLDSTTQLPAIKGSLNQNFIMDSPYQYTPLAETLWTAARFFSQASTRPYHTSDYIVDQAHDPLYYSEYGKVLGCGKNYVIIITDGESTQDTNVPQYTPETASLPIAQRIKVRGADNDKASDGSTDCDAVACPCSSTYSGCGYNTLRDCNCSDYPFSSSYGGSTYLDDVAYYARHNDLRTLTGTQYLTTHTVFAFGTGGGVAEKLLQKTAANGGGAYFSPQTADDLQNNLSSVFDIIMNKAAAAASTAITSEPISGVDLIYIPYYKHPYADQWWGNIRAFRMGTDGSLLQGATGTTPALDTDHDLVLENPKWDAAILLESKAGTTDSRTIYTYIPGQTNPYPFIIGNAGTIGKYFDVDLNNDGIKDTLAEEQALISYIRGNDSVGFSVRSRKNNQVPATLPSYWYLGDIMHANPVFVGKPSARYDVIYGDQSYWDFYWTASVQNRTQVLYAAANDGMIHCFDAASGEELWAYIPYNLLPHLKWLADPNYGSCHSYYNDLTANVWDMKLGSGWKSVLVGGMRLGGTPIGVDADNNGTLETNLRSAMFALDVTNPNNPQVLWEKNSDGTSDKFGYTTSKPIPVKVGSTWYLLFGSGPKSRDGEGAPSPGDGYTDNNGYIFVVDPNSGSTTTISLGTLGVGNFFGAPVAIDYDLDYSVDMIYIGDAKGNLWRIKTFTESGTTKTYQTSPSNWAIDVTGAAGVTNPQPLLSLSPTTLDQPIVIKPTVTMDEKGRVWIYFGTGRYYCASDNDYCNVGNVCPSSGGCTFADSVGTRSKYMAVGVYDRHWYNDTAHPENSKFVLQSGTLNFATNPNVLDHRVIKSGTIVGNGQTGYYVVDSTTGDIATDVSTNANGWYFHLLADKEKSLGDYLVYQGAVFFISFKPDTSDPCSNNGGLSNLYGVNYTSGTSTAQSFFDLTGEGTINGDDLVRDAGNDRGAALIGLGKGFAGGGLKIKQFELSGGGTTSMGYTPLAEEGLSLNPPGEKYHTGVTSWREVLQ